MDEDKYTEKGMPIVSKETYDAYFGRYIRRGNSSETDYGRHLTEVRDRLIRENPTLADFLDKQVGKYSREFHRPVLDVVIGLYALMENQTEANIMNELENL